MAEYIDRADLIKNLKKFAPEHYTDLINQLVMKQPTAECKHKQECESMQRFLEDLSPYGVVKLVEENQDMGGD